MSKLKTNLIKYLAIPLVAFGIGGCNSKYKIDGNLVIYDKNDWLPWDIKEKKSSGETIYYFDEKVSIIEKDGFSFRQYLDSNSEVFKEAQKRKESLLNKIDSINNEKIRKIDSINNEKIRKLDSIENEQIRKDLEVVRK